MKAEVLFIEYLKIMRKIEQLTWGKRFKITKSKTKSVNKGETNPNLKELGTSKLIFAVGQSKGDRNEITIDLLRIGTQELMT